MSTVDLPQLGAVTPGAAELCLSTELIIKRCQVDRGGRADASYADHRGVVPPWARTSE